MEKRLTDERIVKCDLIEGEALRPKSVAMFVQFSGAPCKEIAAADTDDPLAIFLSLTPTQP